MAHAARVDAAASAEAPGYLFRALSQMIGGREAERISHIQATLGCLRDLWKDSELVGFRQPVTGHLLRQLIRERASDCATILQTVLASTRDMPKLTEYIFVWLKGHFLFGAVLAQDR